MFNSDELAFAESMILNIFLGILPYLRHGKSTEYVLFLGAPWSNPSKHWGKSGHPGGSDVQKHHVGIHVTTIWLVAEENDSHQQKEHQNN
jgi:hypothetical protein